MTIKNNTKAFPSPQDVRVRGMDLRDYLAGQVMSGIVARIPEIDRETIHRLSAKAYAIADVMMLERDR